MDYTERQTCQDWVYCFLDRCLLHWVNIDIGSILRWPRYIKYSLPSKNQTFKFHALLVFRLSTLFHKINLFFLNWQADQDRYISMKLFLSTNSRQQKPIERLGKYLNQYYMQSEWKMMFWSAVNEPPND